MNATSPEPHDHHHAMQHAAHVSRKAFRPHGTTEHAGHGETGAPDRHAGHSVAMFRDRFWITLLLSIPTLVWCRQARSSWRSTRNCCDAPNCRPRKVPKTERARDW
jgi:hypothetical protein